MERKEYIISTLVKNGFRSALKGFDQFCECVELYLDDRTVTIESIYARTADKFRCTKSSVEKNLRRLFTSSDACSIMGRLYGMDFPDAGNKEIVAVFSNYVALHRDCYNTNKGTTNAVPYT